MKYSLARRLEDGNVPPKRKKLLLKRVYAGFAGKGSKASASMGWDTYAPVEYRTNNTLL